MMRNNFLKEKISSGGTAIGTWSIIPSAVNADILASTGLDFLIIDAEHGPLGFETAQAMAIACESRGVSPVMRVSGLVEGEILKALDIGVHCVQIPNVDTCEGARRAVSFAKYPPAGRRGFSPFTRAGGYTAEYARELTARANENTLIAVHIEGKEAIGAIDTILAVEGIDIIFIGIYDISKSLGIPGDVTNTAITETLQRLCCKINEAGKCPGSIAGSAEQLQHFIKYGVRYITYSVDCAVIRDTYRDIVSVFRRLNTERT